MPRPVRLLKHYYSYCETSQKTTTKQWFDLRAKVRGAMQDLKFFAEKLPSEQYETVFTDEMLEPLIQVIMKREITTGEESGITRDPIRFKIGCMLLKWSLNITGSLLNNYYAKEMWRERELPMRKIVELLYYDVKRETGGLKKDKENVEENSAAWSMKKTGSQSSQANPKEII